MNASLNEKLGTVKWGEFKLIDVFTLKTHPTFWHITLLRAAEQFHIYAPVQKTTLSVHTLTTIKNILKRVIVSLSAGKHLL